MRIELKQEETRSRLAYVLVGFVGLVLLGTVVASFRLPPSENVAELKDLSSTLLVIVVGALAYYFGTKKKD